MNRFLLCTISCLALSATSATAQADEVRPIGDDGRLASERLSDERTVTRWANATGRSLVRVKPDSGSRSVGRLRFRTEDGPPEVYVVLRSKIVDRRLWLKIRLPQRPNGTKGWVRREALGPLRAVTTFLRVDKRRLRATLYRRGRRIWSSRVGIGTPSTPTPSGHFYVRQRLRNLKGSPVYGPWAFGTSAYSVLSDWPGGGVIGIHGTNQPDLIPGRPSHGCVRVPNDRLRVLARLMPVGTPVHIS